MRQADKKIEKLKAAGFEVTQKTYQVGPALVNEVMARRGEDTVIGRDDSWTLYDGDQLILSMTTFGQISRRVKLNQGEKS